jgi:hypothetical protein
MSKTLNIYFINIHFTLYKPLSKNNFILFFNLNFDFKRKLIVCKEIQYYILS